MSAATLASSVRHKTKDPGFRRDPLERGNSKAGPNDAIGGEGPIEWCIGEVEGVPAYSKAYSTISSVVSFSSCSEYQA